MQRRTLLGLGLTGGAALALAGGALWLHAPAWQAGHLLEPGRRVLHAVARAVLDGSLPAEPTMQARALAQHLARIELTLRALPPHAQREVAQLLSLLATPYGRVGLALVTTAWPEASIDELQSGLQSMRSSSMLLRRQAYGALRDLTHAAFYADASTWAALGYPGPTRVA